MKNKYSVEYNRKHYKQFKAFISIDEYEKLKSALNDLKMSNATFIRWAIDKIMIEKR